MTQPYKLDVVFHPEAHMMCQRPVPCTGKSSYHWEVRKMSEVGLSESLSLTGKRALVDDYGPPSFRCLFLSFQPY